RGTRRAGWGASWALDTPERAAGTGGRALTARDHGDLDYSERMRMPYLRFTTLVALLAPCLIACGDETELRTSLPARPVDVIVDSMGVPHLYAKSDDDAFFGAGYQMATDRLYQMEMLRRFALGRLAEVLGDAGFERDRQARTFDFARWGRADAALEETIDPERARLVRAWTAGINRRIDEV